ncbi:DUF982 domain-containing protein [Ancylobacter defluvii]|nr:DUF982 domain-containing protein [Ancylobacter defluvii]MBS7589060.1 DUF982 domain-containing protein [Ancylobacter defluvii]
MYTLMQPVTVWEATSTKRILTDVEGAARFLLECWPEQYTNTTLHRLARQRALEALDRHIPVAAFRTAFIAAAEEADVMADPPSQGLRLG